MIAALVIGVASLIMGLISKYSTVERNSLFGYRTFLSMKNEANWEFANKQFATHAILIGIIALLAGSISYFFKIGESFIIFFVLTLLLISIITIEIRLRKFDKANGK